jgi:hypothetical protein
MELHANFVQMCNSPDYFVSLHDALPKMPPSTTNYPPEAFELYEHFPKYPTSGSRADQLAFISDMLDEEPPFPKEVHDLWCNFYDEYPMFAPQQHKENQMVRAMRTWKSGPPRRRTTCEIERIQRKVEDGADAVELIRPDFERIPDFERKLAGLIESCVEHKQVSSLELQVCGGVNQSLHFLDLHLLFQGTPLGAMEGRAFRAVVKLVRAMRNNGRRINFIGLTGTMLSNQDASELASALNSLADRDATSASQESQEIPDSTETLEILQVSLSAEARAELKAASARSGVNVLLSRVNGPALATPVY